MKTIKGIKFSQRPYRMYIGDLDLNCGEEYEGKRITFRDGKAETDDGKVVIEYSTLVEVKESIKKGKLSIDDFDLYGDFEINPVNFFMVQYVTCKSTKKNGKKLK